MDDANDDAALNLPLCFPGDEAEGDISPRRSSQQDQRYARSPGGRAEDKAADAPTYTVYVRVAGPRNGFVDPPDVHWSHEKDDALWKILSGVSRNNIDWQDLALQFDSTVDFLVVQATILAERQVSQVRAQTRKVATSAARDSPVPSPLLGDRPNSQTAGRAATPVLVGDGLVGDGVQQVSSSSGKAATATAATTATTTATTTPMAPTDHVRPRFAAISIDSPELPPAAVDVPQHHHRRRYDTEEEVDQLSATAMSSPSESDSDSSTPSQPVMSRIFKRPPGFPIPDTLDTHNSLVGGRVGGRISGRFGATGHDGLNSSTGSDGGDESETQPAFLPFKSPVLDTTPGRRIPTRAQKSPSPSPKSQTFTAGARAVPAPSASTSGASSPATAARMHLHPSRLPVMRSSSSVLRRNRNPSAGHSPSNRRPSGYSREGSETATTPSMGSSFSDLDDVSLTQSVLDEALASRVEDSSTRSDTQSSSTLSRRR